MLLEELTTDKEEKSLRDLNARKAPPQLFRVVWGKEPTVIPTNDPSELSIDQNLGAYRGIHVTTTPKQWYKVLQDEYDRDGDAYIIRLYTSDQDYIINDTQYAVPSDKYDLNSDILLTHRKVLRKDKDFEIVKKLRDNRKQIKREVIQDIKNEIEELHSDGELDHRFEDQDFLKNYFDSHIEQYLDEIDIEDIDWQEIENYVVGLL